MENLQTLPKYPEDRMKFRGEYIAYVEHRIVAHFSEMPPAVRQEGRRHSRKLREVLQESKKYSEYGKD